MCLAFSIPNLLISSLQYFDLLINIPFFICFICSPRKKFNSLTMDISNSFCISWDNSLRKESLVDPKIISSTFICTKRISCNFLLIKSVVSTFPLVKPFSKRNLLKRSYQALGACFKPYRAFFNLNTWLGLSEFSKPGGWST